MTSYTEVVSSFESIIKCKYKLDDGLVYQWFLNALGEYELNIESLGYNKTTMEFKSPSSTSNAFDKDGNLKNHIILTLAEMMKSYYMQQEVRRVNQLNNIIGKDISLNGTGDTKKYTKAESDAIDSKIADLFTKQKVPAYV
jgi:hypothetical protein